MIQIKPELLYVRDPDTKEFTPLLAIKGPAGSISDISDYLTSETGDSEKLAMTQKGVTQITDDIRLYVSKLALEMDAVNALPGEEYYDIIDADNAVIYYTTSNLSEIRLPSHAALIPVTEIGSVNINTTYNEDLVFTVIIPNTVERINQEAFGVLDTPSVDLSGALTISDIYIPKSVKYIHGNNFYGRVGTTIHYEGTEQEWNSIFNDAYGGEFAAVEFNCQMP